MKLNKSYNIITSSLVIIKIGTLFTVKLRGYTYDYYDLIPIYFWILTYLIYILQFLNSINKRKLDVFDVLIITINNMIVLLSPHIVGIKCITNGDFLSYSGMTLDIIKNYFINFNYNFYPATNLLSSILCLTTNIDPSFSTGIISPLLSLIVPLIMFYIGAIIFQDKLICVYLFYISSNFYLSSIYQYNSITFPTGFSILYLPFLLYFIIKKENARKKIPLIFLLIFYIFIHPIGSLILTIVFVILTYKKDENKNIYLLFIILNIIYLLYLTYMLKTPIHYIIKFIQGDNINFGYRVNITQSLLKLQLTRFETIILFIKLFGNQSFYIISSFIIILSNYHLITTKKVNMFIRFYILICSILIFISIFLPNAMNISFTRFVGYITIFAPIFVVIIFKSLIIKNKKYILLLLTSVLYLNSLLLTFSSPYAKNANSQITNMDYEGTSFFINYKYENVSTTGYFAAAISRRIMSQIIPYSDYLLKYYRELYPTEIDDHLGYINGTHHNNYKNMYVLLNKYDEIAYSTVYNKINRLNKSDIMILINDKNISYVYNNKEYSIYYIK